MYRKREWRRKTEWNKAEWWQAEIEWKGSRIGLEGGRRVRRRQRCGRGLKERRGTEEGKRYRTRKDVLEQSVN